MASDNTIYKYKPCALSTIVTDEYVKLKINQVVYNMNNVVIAGYFILDLYCIMKFQENDKQALTYVNFKDDALFIRDCLNITRGEFATSKGSRAKSPTQKRNESDESYQKRVEMVNHDKIETAKIKQQWKNDLQHIYNDIVKPNLPDAFVDKDMVYPPCVKNIAKEMMTIFLNNIKEHFVQRLKTLVNVVFKDKLLKTHDKNIAYKILGSIKNDLISNTRESPSEYHDWINDISNNIFISTTFDKCLEYDLNKNTIQYLYGSMYINKCLEDAKSGKLYKVLPLRSSCTKHFIKLDTETLYFMFNKYCDFKVSDKEDNYILFNSIFHMECIDETFMDLSFNYKILTDGYSCRLQYCSSTKSSYAQRKNDNWKAKLATREAKYTKHKYITDVPELFSSFKQPDWTIDGIDAGQSGWMACSKNISQTNCSANRYKKYRNYVNRCKKHYKPINKKAVDKIFKSTIKPRKFHHSKSFYDYSYSNRRFLNYSNRRHKILKDRSKDIGIEEAETVLSKACSDKQRYSVYLDRFIHFMIHKFELIKQVNHHYQDELYKKLAWIVFTKNKQERDEMINNYIISSGITDVTKHVVAIGDWSSKSTGTMRGTIPGYGKTLLKLFKSRFPHVYLVNEFRTSVVCNECKCNLKCKNYSFKSSKTDKVRSVHRILCCQNTNCKIIWHRDINGSSNILEKAYGVIHGIRDSIIFDRSITMI